LGYARIRLSLVAQVLKVAMVDFEESASECYKDALKLIGGISDLNTARRDVVIKVGVFNPKSLQRTSIPVLSSILESFNKGQKIFVVESDNYCGPALDRLELWRDVFTERVVPSSLSSGSNTRTVQLTEQVPGLPYSDVLRLGALLLRIGALMEQERTPTNPL
jgi:hypothetical protein